jgi:prophage regulatory protein
MPSPTIERRLGPRTNTLRLVRIREVVSICGLSRSSIYIAIKDGRFPRPVASGGRARAWVQHEVENWAGQRIRERQAAQPA